VTRLAFLNGPAEHDQFDVDRVPEYLRIAVANGCCRPLAGLEDAPLAEESIVVYRKLGTAPNGIVGYAVDDEFPTDPPERLRDVTRWRATVEAVLAERKS